MNVHPPAPLRRTRTRRPWPPRRRETLRRLDSLLRRIHDQTRTSSMMQVAQPLSPQQFRCTSWTSHPERLNALSSSPSFSSSLNLAALNSGSRAVSGSFGFSVWHTSQHIRLIGLFCVVWFLPETASMTQIQTRYRRPGRSAP